MAAIALLITAGASNGFTAKFFSSLTTHSYNPILHDARGQFRLHSAMAVQGFGACRTECLQRTSPPVLSATRTDQIDSSDSDEVDLGAADWALVTRRVRDPSNGRETTKSSLEAARSELEAVSLCVQLNGIESGLGIALEEVTGEGETISGDRRSGALVLVRALVPGGVAAASAAAAAANGESSILPGDSIVAVSNGRTTVSTEAVGYEELVRVLQSMTAEATTLTLTLKRVVERATADVTVVTAEGDEKEFRAYSGENLRMGLIRRGLAPNDMTAKRYDNKPAGTGDCGGNGLCCTCVVTVLSGNEHLSPATTSEKQVLRNGKRWRQSCRAKLQLAQGERVRLRIALGPRGESAARDAEAILGPEFRRGV
uniref:PDZ domain-containing protein n=1 Tax=Chrysotila carterae TaxID=13221 RepID=A0A7S4B0W3_CHRCT|mmetsp:Transcript_41697/g.91536  ORF Transcript_41697/g.91536 Transcript_41697/m.91536 type:complete len:371 (+) Transcript_41697:226-1338(+)